MIKTKMLLVILISILLTNFFVVSSTGEEINPDEVKHVLVINAYHKGFEWTDNMTEAIQATLNAYDETILVSVEYIDWKRYPDQANLDYQYDLLKYKYKDEHISLIIGTDDIGMQFAIDHRAEIFNNAPIVFTAVFEEAAQNMMAGESNITGIYETIDCTGTIKAIMTIHPDLEHVYIVRDNSESAKGLEDSI
ncbi:MAG: hypothetical protein PF505_10955 [Vallitaleaceae bacterium]|jgi:ABC-type uncharacterized transport system substrate-binding protein|nr:hypothetical protein [Vallitaleaceae bacterium]